MARDGIPVDLWHGSPAGRTSDSNLPEAVQPVMGRPSSTQAAVPLCMVRRDRFPAVAHVVKWHRRLAEFIIPAAGRGGRHHHSLTDGLLPAVPLLLAAPCKSLGSEDCAILVKSFQLSAISFQCSDTGSKLKAEGIDKPGGITGWHKLSLVPARPGRVDGDEGAGVFRASLRRPQKLMGLTFVTHSAGISSMPIPEVSSA